MAPTQSSLSGERNLKGGNQLNGASPGSTSTHSGESFTLSGSEMVKQEHDETQSSFTVYH
jgi:hypothetical protein